MSAFARPGATVDSEGSLALYHDGSSDSRRVLAQDIPPPLKNRTKVFLITLRDFQRCI